MPFLCKNDKGDIIGVALAQQHILNPAYDSKLHKNQAIEVVNPDFNNQEHIVNPDYDDQDPENLRLIINPDYNISVPPRIPNPDFVPQCLDDRNCVEVKEDDSDLVKYLAAIKATKNPV